MTEELIKDHFKRNVWVTRKNLPGIQRSSVYFVERFSWNTTSPYHQSKSRGRTRWPIKMDDDRVVIGGWLINEEQLMAVLTLTCILLHLLLASRAPGWAGQHHLDNHILRNHPPGHPRSFGEEFLKNANFKHVTEFLHLNIIPVRFYNDYIPYFIK